MDYDASTLSVLRTEFVFGLCVFNTVSGTHEAYGKVLLNEQTRKNI